jgi:hypothetical protein
LYWYSVLPFHGFIFKGMINKLAEEDKKGKVVTPDKEELEKKV